MKISKEQYSKLSKELQVYFVSNQCNNTHCCTKPLALFNYLIHLFSSENDIILDPFCGSGTTCISAKLTKRKYIGIEMDENYCEISRSRLKFWGENLIQKKQQDLF